MKTIHILGGGTVNHVRNHMALTAPAYGATARKLYELTKYNSTMGVQLHLTKMASAGVSELETNEDISKLIDKLILDDQVKIVFFNVALVDYKGYIEGLNFADTKSGKYEERLKTSLGSQNMKLYPDDKIISKIRKKRKDIFLIGFKTTCGASEDEQFLTGLNLLKSSSCNLVLANDTKTRVNMIITPEQARYSVSKDRDSVLNDLVEMALARSQGNFTRSTVVEGESIHWNSEEIPNSLREVVNYCIEKGAYKPFNGKTAGHFAIKKDEKTFFTSKRKVNFNELDKVGLVKIETDGDAKVIAHGALCSVGGQSQRIIFKDHPEMDSIVHFHVPPKDIKALSVRSQKEFECGSHECGKNTSLGLRYEQDGIKCVYLDKHGPNIVFNSKKTNAESVISFIDKNFDLSQSTDEIDRSVIYVD